MIETGRLKLRVEEESDVYAIYDMLIDPEVRKYTGGVFKKSVEHLQEIIKSNSGKFTLNSNDISNDNGYCAFGVIDKVTDEYMGCCGFRFCRQMNEVELFYLYRRNFWGKGFGSEAAKAVLKFGFETIGLPAIFAAVDPVNTASEKILIKIGMNYLRMVEWSDKKMLKMYVIKKEEYLLMDNLKII